MSEKPNTDPNAYYQTRIASYLSRLARLKHRDCLFAASKIVLFMTMAYLLWRLTAQYTPARLWQFSAVFALFIAAALAHEKILRTKKRWQLEMQINMDEARSLRHEFLAVDDGSMYRDDAHAYTADLDIFGPRSVFHLLNRTTTTAGRNTLAGWLVKPAQTAELTARQAAVLELAQQPELRQELRCLGLEQPEDSRAGAIDPLWTAPLFLERTRWLRWLAHAMPALMAVLLPLACINRYCWLAAVALALCNIAINLFFYNRVSTFYKLALKQWKVLQRFARQFELLERGAFDASCLRDVQHDLQANGGCASREIARLADILGWFSVRHSDVLHFALNNVLYWDIHCLCWLQRWRKRNETHVQQWFAALGAAEALASLATLCFNRPHWHMPEIGDYASGLDCAELGHPLIPAERCVCNPIAIGKGQTITIVTGPNMAGKSTFLRTVGVNIVLALAGSAVYAARMRLPYVHLHTSLTISDSLDQNVSLFYAELNRLKQIVDAMQANGKIFFLIDEMLKGTNTADRQQGSLALVRKLARAGALGMIATHDLKLAALAVELPAQIDNVHVDGHLVGEELVFDYLVKPGLCTSANALFLMRKLGIDV